MPLQPTTDGVCMDRVARTYRIPLTNGCPNQERYWRVPDLNGGRGGYDTEAKIAHE